MNLKTSIWTPARAAIHSARLAFRRARANPTMAGKSLSRATFNDWKTRHPELHGELSREVSNRYEAARRWTPDRRNIWSEVLDARDETDEASLWEMLRKALYFEQNSPVVNRLCDVFEQYTVGANGLRAFSDSQDQEWSKAADDKLAEWSEAPDLSCRQGLAERQSLSARVWMVQGECFIILTRTDEPPYEPRIQIVEPHRVATPNNLADAAGGNIFNGVEINPKSGRPLAYWVRTDFTGDRFRRVPADFVVHIGEPTRPGMLRCPTMLSGVLNTLHDLDDLCLCEMSAAKRAAVITEIIKTPSGELPDDGDLDEVALEGDGENPRRAFYKSILSSGTKVLFSGDDYQQVGSNRPTVSQQWFFRWLTEQVCTGGPGIPLALVYPESMQGTVARGVLDQAATHFRSRSATLAAAWKRVRNYVLETYSYTDRLLAAKPPDWRKCTILPPRQPNVDVGRNSSALIAEREAGLRTDRDIYGELQQDYREAYDQLGREAAERKKAAEKWGVESIAGTVTSSDEPAKEDAKKPAIPPKTGAKA